MLRIKGSALQKAIAQAERDYPYETCGLLLGKVEGNLRTVFGVYETPNANPDRKHDRYEIAPEDYLSAEKKAKEFGLEIVGVYHSHPDHPDRPSTGLSTTTTPFALLSISLADSGDSSDFNLTLTASECP